MNKIYIFDGVVSIDHYKLTLDQIQTVFPGFNMADDVLALTYDRDAELYLEATETSQRRNHPKGVMEALEQRRQALMKAGAKEQDLEPLPVALDYPCQALEEVLDKLLEKFPELEDPELSEEEQQQELFGLVEATKSNITGNAGKCKLTGWITKEQRANRIKAGQGTDTDNEIIQIEATHRGLNETPEQLVDLQLAKANNLGKVVAFLDGLESDYIKSVKGRKIKRKDFKAIIKNMNDDILAFLSQGSA